MKEALERAERESKEKEEADATSKRLAELEEFERKKVEERKQAEALSATMSASEPVASTSETKSSLGEPSQPTISAASTHEVKSLSSSVEMMGRMSLDETRSSVVTVTEKKEDDDKKKREPVLAS
jgi:hypothetical protein